jgi:hypothetical protein
VGGPDEDLLHDRRFLRPRHDAADDAALRRRPRDDPPGIGIGDQVEEIAGIGQLEERLGPGGLGIAAGDREREVDPVDPSRQAQLS